MIFFLRQNTPKMDRMWLPDSNLHCVPCYGLAVLGPGTQGHYQPLKPVQSINPALYKSSCLRLAFQTGSTRLQMGENIFVWLKSEQKFTCEQKAASTPWDGLKILVAVSLWLCFAATLCCAVPSPPRQSCPRNQEEPCALFRGTWAVTVSLYSRYLWRSLPCSQAPQPTLSFPPAGELLLAGNRGKRPWQPCATGRM